MAKNLIVEEVISRVTSDDFAFSEDDSDEEEGKSIYAYQGSSSTDREAAEYLATNILSSGQSTEDKSMMSSHFLKA